MSEPHPGRSQTGKSGETAVGVVEEIKKHIRDLLTEDGLTKEDSLSYLGKHGKEAAPILVDLMVSKSSQPFVLDPIAHALQEIGKPSIGALIHALSHLEIRREEDLYLLDSMVNTLWRLHDRRAAVSLLLQVNRLNKIIKRHPHKGFADLCEASKVRIHVVLSDLGISAGRDDLLDMLGDGRRRVRDGVVDALEKIGDRKALLPLLRLHELEVAVSDWSARNVRNIFREIARREKVTSEDRLFRNLAASERDTLERFLPPSKPVETHAVHRAILGHAPIARRATS